MFEVIGYFVLDGQFFEKAMQYSGEHREYLFFFREEVVYLYYLFHLRTFTFFYTISCIEYIPHLFMRYMEEVWLQEDNDYAQSCSKLDDILKSNK